MGQEMKNAIEKARKLEIDGAEYYSRVADECSVEMGKYMFRSFADDEKRHLRIIEDVAKGMGVDIDSMPMPRDEIRTIFSHADEHVSQQVIATADEKEAVRVAMNMETESFKLYDEAAKAADDEQVEKLFSRLAREENQHYEMLENTLDYLDSNEKWFLQNEWALIVGDQSSLGLG